MTQRYDSAGLMTSSTDAVSLDSYEQAIVSLFRADGRALPTIERALARDPAFTAGHCLRAGALVLGGSNTAAATLAAIDCGNRAQGGGERARAQACGGGAALARWRCRGRRTALR